MIEMASLSARMSGITQSAGLFGFNIQMLPHEGSETVLAEIEVPRPTPVSMKPATRLNPP
jgi:hypothetical protein